ncbi:MAG: ABC transporter ATP-binding protein [Lachnospiraceae bacterium]|nr:ABC transporter ATP-binding protein [Lachnospiraceae bacterium]
MLEARGLTKTFVRQLKKGKKETFTALNGVSLKAETGQILGVLGPNGAGKTTLLRILGFLMEPVSGEVVLTGADGERVTQLKECKRRISYLSENTKLYPKFLAREVLRLVGRLYGAQEAELENRIEEISSLLNMNTFIDGRIEKLSTGQKQRISIARCLVADPEIYILDEPTLGLDVLSAQIIVDFMKQEKARGKTVLYSTHYMEEAQALCDHVVILNAGEIIRSGSPAELMSETATDNLRDAFFALIPEEKREVVA